MCGDEQSSPGCLVTSTRLNSDESVLDQIHASDCVPGPDLIQQFDQGYGVELLPIHRNGNSAFETDRNLFFAVGRGLWRESLLPGAGQGSVARIFQLTAFMAHVPEVAIAAVDFRTARFHWNAVLLSVVEAVFSRLQRPFAPGRNYLEFRCECLVSELEAHLIIAFASAPMGNSSGTFAKRDFNLMFRYDWSRQ